MKNLKNFEKDLNKCSKCGLCEQACPLFKLVPNECIVSKGKFIMLHGVTIGDLKLSKNINKYLDLCLKCGKCNDFCPSGIEVCQILNTAKYEYAKTKFLYKVINVLESKCIFSNIIKIFELLTKPFRPKKNSKQATTKVLYFKGCVNHIFPQTDKYIHKIFKNFPIEIIEKPFDCCGLPFLSDGNLERFEQVAKHNTELIENTKYDYLITDCASCESTILDYSKYFENLAQIQESKSINWGDLIAAKGIKFRFKKLIKVTFHKPCHLKNDTFLKQILKNCENVEYIEMDNYDECCGFAGSFTFKNYKLSKELTKQKANYISATNTDFVITSCPSCILGLKYGLHLAKNKKTKVVSLLEFLAKADEITY